MLEVVDKIRPWKGEPWNFFQQKYNGIHIRYKDGKFLGRKEDYTEYLPKIDIKDIILDFELVSNDNQSTSVIHYMKEQKLHMLRAILFAVYNNEAHTTDYAIANTILMKYTFDLDQTYPKFFFFARCSPPLEQDTYLYYHRDIEGLVLKEYQDKNWYKLVNNKTADVIITNYEKSYKLGANYGNIAKLIGSQYNKEGKFVVVASIATGLSEAMRMADPSTYIGKVVEVEYRDLTKNGKFRFCSFKRFRDDKPEKECIHD